MLGRDVQHLRPSLYVWTSVGNDRKMVQISLICFNCEEEQQLQEELESQNLARFLSTHHAPRINSSDASEESLGAALTECRR